MKSNTITQEDLDNDPNLAAQGLEVGDEFPVGEQSLGDDEDEAPEEEGGGGLPPKTPPPIPPLAD